MAYLIPDHQHRPPKPYFIGMDGFQARVDIPDQERWLVHEVIENRYHNFSLLLPVSQLTDVLYDRDPILTVCSTTIGTSESLTTGFLASSPHVLLLDGPASFDFSKPKYLLDPVAMGDESGSTALPFANLVRKFRLTIHDMLTTVR
jgi:hypothetical protein